VDQVLRPRLVQLDAPRGQPREEDGQSAALVCEDARAALAARQTAPKVGFVGGQEASSRAGEPPRHSASMGSFAVSHVWGYLLESEREKTCERVSHVFAVSHVFIGTSSPAHRGSKAPRSRPGAARGRSLDSACYGRLRPWTSRCRCSPAPKAASASRARWSPVN